MLNTILNCDVLDGLKQLPDGSVNCCVTSPPYWGLRDYGNDNQIGLEKTPDEYVAKMVQVFSEVKRVLKKDGNLWLNLGDSYISAKCDYMPNQTIAGNKKRDYIKRDSGLGYPPNRIHQEGLKTKDLVGIPWLVAFALRADGWYLRQDIIWHKPNPMPESVTDRCTKSHEYIFLMSKSQRYYYDYESVLEEATGFDGRTDTMFKGGVKYNGHDQQTMLSRGHERWKYKNLSEKGQQPHSMHEKRALGIADELTAVRNKRSVWTVNTKPFSGAHFATFPEKLIEPCIKAGCPEGGVVLDPFMGAGTTALVAKKLNRNYIGIELNPDYIKIAEKRIFNEIGLFV